MIRVEGVHRTYENLELAMQGEFQVENAALAVASIDLLAGFGMLDAPPSAIRKGLMVEVPGRFEIIQQKPTVILDGAHNLHKAQALAASLEKQFPGRKMTIILGTLSIKDFSGIIKALAPIAKKWIATQPHVFGKPAASPSELAAVIRKVTPHLEIVETPDVRTAVKHIRTTAWADEVIVITGSLYLLGEARGMWYPVDKMLAEIESRE